MMVKWQGGMIKILTRIKLALQAASIANPAVTTGEQPRIYTQWTSRFPITMSETET
jgi:hypothetical protein